jgi:predicted acyltransferase
MKKQRILSLDVLRGATVALMILVNNAGDGDASYPQLRHSVWNGCTLTDLVFPMFLFIVGASIAFALRRRTAEGSPRGIVLRQILKRSALILALGLLLNALPAFQLGELRYFGVLQRIALCYALAAALYVYGGVRWASFAIFASLAGYWYLLLHVRVPGYGMPGVDVGILDPHGNLAAWLDRRLVPPAHIYHHGFYDPEGLLSTIPALATTLVGILAGCWLQTSRPAKTKAAALTIAGIFLCLAGLAWAHSFPLNKRLWTDSYVLWTGGISLAVLGPLFWAIDGPWQLRRGLLPWRIFGTNALAAYILSEVLAILLAVVPVPGAGNLQRWLFHLLPSWIGPPSFVSMLYSILFTGVCLLPIAELYRRKIFLKL